MQISPNKRFKSTCLTAAAACSVFTVSPPVHAQNREPEAAATIEATLERFAADYADDAMASDVVFGIDVDGMRWTLTSKFDAGKPQVTLTKGFANTPMPYFTMGRETLNLIDQGVWSPLTAMGAATSADETPLDVQFTQGYEKPADYDTQFRRIIFHFWTKGFPEKAPIGTAHARVVHGAPATALYYDKDFRSAVYHIPGGVGREQAPTIAVPFPRMVIILSGQGEGVAGDKEFTLQSGEMVFMPQNIPVTFWNANERETLSFVWLMWGDGA